MILNIIVLAWSAFALWYVIGLLVISKRRPDLPLISKRTQAVIILWPLVLALDALGVYSE